MKAVYIREFGSSVDITDVSTPDDPAPGEVIVRVRAAGLNRADLLQAKGLYPPPEGYDARIPGLEYAGEIAAIGEGVARLQLGDRVFGITAGEAQAEFVKVDASTVVEIPANLSFVEAAAVPEAFITAHDAAFTQAGLQQGEFLLVHAAGSGVGLAAVQLGKAFGAIVIGTSRTAEKLERCTEYGLDKGIAVADDRPFQDEIMGFSQGRGADVILDLVGAAYFGRNLLSLAKNGRMMLVGLTSGAKAEFDMRIALQRRATIKGTVLRSRSLAEKVAATTEFESSVLPLLAVGKLKPVIDQTFPAADVVSVYEHLATNQSFGKVVLEF